MKKLRIMKREIDILVMSLMLVSIVILTTVTVKKSPNMFCYFISWLSVCEEERNV